MRCPHGSRLLLTPSVAGRLPSYALLKWAGVIADLVAEAVAFGGDFADVEVVVAQIRSSA